MPIYEVESDGKTFEVDAPDIKKAVPMARLFVARERMTDKATSEAKRRSDSPAPNKLLDFVSRFSGVGSQEDREKLLQTRESERRGAVQGGSVALPIVAAGPLAAQFIAAPMAAAGAVGAGVAGAEVGGRGGRVIGRAAETLGAPKGTASALGTVGELGGGIAAAAGGAGIVNALRKVAATPVERAVIEALAKRAAGVGAAEAAIPAEAAAASKVLPAGRRAMATNLGGMARPGPAPTPPDELEAALKASLDKIKNAPPLKGPRIEVGAQKVGRQVGMTKEEVRKATGPVLDEAVGEASPILPKKALTSIIDTMKAIPVAEREAYVAKATSGKAKWQVENIRRTLEHLGLLLPVGAVAAMEGQE